MSGFSTIFYIILSASQFIILLRYICQIMKVNYYNPVTQSIIKLSGYIVRPLEIFMGGINSYILFLILYLFTFLKLYFLVIASGQEYPLDDLSVISLQYLFKDFLNIFWYLIIISAIKSWFNVFVSHPIFNLIDEICEPLYSYVRGFLPSLSGIDFSPVVILLVIQVFDREFIPRIFNLIGAY
tara:strand:- start:6 stop:554 length:549 start_codon:yes stop_codon:yes gene_type:complete